MLIEEYKEKILYELEIANNGDEVEDIINHSIAQFPDGDSDRFLVIIYLHLLQDGLEKLSDKNFDFVKWRNIRFAVEYLKNMNDNRGKVE